MAHHRATLVENVDTLWTSPNLQTSTHGYKKTVQQPQHIIIQHSSRKIMTVTQENTNTDLITLDRAIVVKVGLADDLRRISLPVGQPLDYAEFRSTLLQLFPEAESDPTELRLLWTDPEGDLITLACREDLEEAGSRPTKPGSSSPALV